MHRTPTIAQKALPVIDEPWMMFVPWPTQTAPVRTSTAPTIRLAITIRINTRGSRTSVPTDHARFERNHRRLPQCAGMTLDGWPLDSRCPEDRGHLADILAHPRHRRHRPWHVPVLR